MNSDRSSVPPLQGLADNPMAFGEGGLVGAVNTMLYGPEKPAPPPSPETQARAAAEHARQMRRYERQDFRARCKTVERVVITSTIAAVAFLAVIIMVRVTLMVWGLT